MRSYIANVDRAGVEALLSRGHLRAYLDTIQSYAFQHQLHIVMMLILV